MTGTTTAIRTVDLRTLYAPVAAVRGCRTCGIMGWDEEIGK